MSGVAGTSVACGNGSVEAGGYGVAACGEPYVPPATQFFPTAAVLDTNASNHFATVGGGGAGAPPQFGVGKTMVFVFQDAASTSGIAQFGLLASARGWAFGIDRTSKNPYVRAYGNAATVLPNQPSGQPMAPDNDYLRVALTVTAGGVLRGSVNGCPVTGTAYPAYTPAAGGDTFTLGKNEIAAGGASSIFGMVLLNRSFSDAELVAASAIQDNRYDLSALSADPTCTQAWTALQDWDGVAATSTTRGSAPLVMTVNGGMTLDSYVEGRIPISAPDVQDSSGVQISGVGINEKQLCAEYGVYGFNAGTGNFLSASVDVIGDNDTNASYDFYQNGVYVGAPNGIYFANDNTRRTIPFQGIINPAVGDLIEIYSSFQSSPPNARRGSVVQALRYRVGAVPYTRHAYNPTRRLVIVGDSIPSGINASAAPLGWGRLTRADYPGRVTFLAYGGAALADYASAIPALADQSVAAVNQGGGVTTPEIWMELGVNDGRSGPMFNVPYAAWLDAVHARDKGVRIYAQSIGVTTTGAEAAWVLQQRIDIAAMCASRPWTTYVDGLTMYTSAQLKLGVHPGDAGQAAAHTRAKAVIGY